MDTDDAGPEALHEYPGDLSERTGTVPAFLKATYVGFVAFGILYFLLYGSGDGSELVRQLNQATANVLP